MLARLVAIQLLILRRSLRLIQPSRFTPVAVTASTIRALMSLAAARPALISVALVQLESPASSLARSMIRSRPVLVLEASLT